MTTSQAILDAGVRAAALAGMERFGMGDPELHMIARPYNRQEKRWAVSVHEAGHAVAAAVQGFRVLSVTLSPGLTMWQAGKRDTPARRMRCHLAGSAAEELISGRYMLPSTQSHEWLDFEQARAATEAAGRRWDASAQVLEVAAWLRPHKSAIRAVAMALLERGELSGDDVQEIVAAHPPQKPKGNRRARRGRNTQPRGKR